MLFSSQEVCSFVHSVCFVINLSVKVYITPAAWCTYNYKKICIIEQKVIEIQHL